MTGKRRMRRRRLERMGYRKGRRRQGQYSEKEKQGANGLAARNTCWYMYMYIIYNNRWTSNSKIAEHQNRQLMQKRVLTGWGWTGHTCPVYTIAKPQNQSSLLVHWFSWWSFPLWFKLFYWRAMVSFPRACAKCRCKLGSADRLAGWCLSRLTMPG